MPGFSERLSAMKGKQEAADLKKQEAEKAAEAARLEREAKRSELAVERDRVMAEFSQTEQTANEAHEAIAQADAFAAEQGENLDAGAKAEIDAMKVEAGEAQQKFEELKQRLDALNIEISAFEESGESQETSAEATAEVVPDEEPTTVVETPQTEVEQTSDTVNKEKSTEAPQVESPEAKKLTPEQEKQLADLKYEIRDEKLLASEEREGLERISSRLKGNKKALDDLKDYLNVIVKKASIGSESGGFTLELVNETRQLRDLGMQQQAKLFELSKAGKSWNQIQADPTIKDLETKMRGLEKEGVSHRCGQSSPDRDTIYFIGPGDGGMIEADGPMPLGEALKKITTQEEGIVKSLQDKIAGREEKIKKLQEQVDQLAA